MDTETNYRTDNKNPITQRLINMLKIKRLFSPQGDQKYIIKRRLMGKSKSFLEKCCGTRMLEIKEIKFQKGNENSSETMLSSTYYFCTKCGKTGYNDGH